VLLATEIRDIRFSHTIQKTRIVIELNRLPEYRIGTLNNPPRIYFDLEETSNSLDTNKLNLFKGPVKKIRIGRFNNNTLRVVFDLDKFYKYKTFVLQSPPRIVVDFIHDRNHFIKPRKVVVIDPGHGGDDPGAIGPRGLKEKDITLDIAKRLKRILERKYNLIVFLTRETDRYISLEDRTRFANKKGADVFISIHVNASRKRNTRGIETYLLNWTNDEEALRVAARENAISIEKMRKSQTELGMILTSLERESKRDESLRLAYYIHQNLLREVTRSYRGIKDLGVKQALFYVLVGAEMPSVLVEVGFISNPKDERLLRNRTFRQKTANSIAKGIYRYILSLPDTPKLAMLKENLPE
jgi:N-acetylmuramoyl-L-alanine amidase